MFADHVHQALAQVKALRQTAIDGQLFRGWSGQARVGSGIVALIGAVVMSRTAFPDTQMAHFLGWGTVFALAVLINVTAMAYWFLRDPSVGRDRGKLRPTLELIPPLAVGGVLTLTLWRIDQVDLLFGIWMSLFGLCNLAGRRFLPRSLAWVGLFYLVAGTVCLLAPAVSFQNPWPMGLVFFVGELAGGAILHLDQRRYLSRR